MFRNIISILPNKKRSFQSYAFVSFVWMLLIFYFSSQQGSSSSSLSGGVVEWLQHFVSIDLESLQFIVRKSAHFFEYICLSILLFQLFSQTSRNRYAGRLAICTCFLYACSDEFHQIFVPGRACMFQDVCIDTMGAILGAFLMFCVMSIILRKKL